MTYFIKIIPSKIIWMKKQFLVILCSFREATVIQSSWFYVQSCKITLDLQFQTRQTFTKRSVY